MSKPTPENSVKSEVKDWLRYHGWFVFPVLQGLGAYKGVSDYIAVKGGVVLFVECKAPRGNPDFVRAGMVKAEVEMERGEMEFADTYFLAKLIMHGNENEQLVANQEWIRRTGKDFPYHPSFTGDEYPIENLK